MHQGAVTLALDLAKASERSVSQLCGLVRRMSIFLGRLGGEYYVVTSSTFSSLLVFGVPKKLSGEIVTAAKPFSHRGRVVTTRERNW